MRPKTFAFLLFLLTLLVIFGYTYWSSSAEVYYVGGKGIIGERDGTISTIVRSFSDGTFILKDGDFSGRFDKDLRMDERLKTELMFKYSKLNYIIHLCNNQGCTGFIAKEKDFNRVKLGDLVKARTSGIYCSIVEVLESRRLG